MSYFDSPKNRAIWERELRGLREEKERRAREGYHPQKEVSSASHQKQRDQNPYRIRISLQELEQEEREAVRARRGDRSKRIRSREAQISQEEKKAPEKQTPEGKALSRNAGGKSL